MSSRTICSYVRREGRITKAQTRALADLYPLYGIELGRGRLDLSQVFGRAAPVILEIGFGDGQSLVEMAEHMPERDFLGVEVYRPGVGQLLRLAHDKELTNLRVILCDAVEVLEKHIARASLDTVQLLFPDPWPKKRHWKRRIVQAHLVELIAGALRRGGHLHFVTDWADYADYAAAVIEKSPQFRNSVEASTAVTYPVGRPTTKFERRGRGLGHPICELIYERF